MQFEHSTHSYCIYMAYIWYICAFYYINIILKACWKHINWIFQHILSAYFLNMFCILFVLHIYCICRIWHICTYLLIYLYIEGIFKAYRLHISAYSPGIFKDFFSAYFCILYILHTVVCTENQTEDLCRAQKESEANVDRLTSNRHCKKESWTIAWSLP